jgi:transcriptional regulator with XRE-family HTH domain
MTFREKISRLMEDRRPSRIAAAAGLSVVSLHNYLRRGSIPRADAALRLSRALNVDFKWLCDDSADWPPIWVNPPEATPNKAA